MTDKIETREAVSVSEMARMCSLSRARWYQLVREGVFPEPLHDSDTGRPYYSEEQQRVCLEVRHRNCGVNGRAVLFYARRVRPPAARTAPARSPKVTPKVGQHAGVVEAVRALGLSTVTAAQVVQAVNDLYPRGAAGVDEAAVIKAVFLRLKRQDSGGNQGR